LTEGPPILSTKQAGSEQRLIAHHLGGQAIARATGEHPFVRILLQQLDVWRVGR
jgi:hypothetical protein